MLLLGMAIGDDAKGDAGSLQRVEDVLRWGIEDNAAPQVLVAVAEEAPDHRGTSLLLTPHSVPAARARPAFLTHTEPRMEQ